MLLAMTDGGRTKTDPRRRSQQQVISHQASRIRNVKKEIYVDFSFQLANAHFSQEQKGSFGPRTCFAFRPRVCVARRLCGRNVTLLMGLDPASVGV